MGGERALLGSCSALRFVCFVLFLFTPLPTPHFWFLCFGAEITEPHLQRRKSLRSFRQSL